MKSQRDKDYLQLFLALYADIASALSCNRVDKARDEDRVRNRVSAEGLPFLTVGLPQLARAVDYALSSGTPLQTPGFRKPKGSQLPSFLGWLFEKVFNSDGTERLDSCPVALRYLRQLLNVYKKLELPYADKLNREVAEKFISTDAGLYNDQAPSSFVRAVVREARKIVARVVGRVDPYGILPRHGPGAVATGEKGSDKSLFRDLYATLETGGYSYTEYFSLASASCDRYGLWGSSLRPQASGTAKVVLVPKDSRGPRLISMEPLGLQWIQQGQMRLLVETIESHKLTRGQVNFTDQTVNGHLALSSSLDQRFVTLDLKDASDRVGLNLVQMLFPDNWVVALEASRSTSTRLPDGREVVLNKFAPMGSANCFPVMALTLWAMAVAGITLRGEGSRRTAAQSVYVYGDDIICRREDYPTVRQCLEEVGLRLSPNKCCTAGFFRESCGVDAHKGVNVTPVRISASLTSPNAPNRLASYIAYSNALHLGGYTQAAALIEEWVQAEWAIPYTGEATTGLLFVRPDEDIRALNRKRGIRTRFSSTLHRYEAYGYRVRVAEETEVNDTWEGVLHALLMPNSSRSLRSRSDLKRGRHGRCYPAPARVSLKAGWTPIVP